jgi:hypothetical protein
MRTTSTRNTPTTRIKNWKASPSERSGFSTTWKERRLDVL